MRKTRSVLTLVLTLTLLAALALPASAAQDTAARAVEAFEQVAANPPARERMEYKGHFYLDFDLDGVPELVLVYGHSYMEDAEALVYYYDGAARAITTGYPFAMSEIGGYWNDSLLGSYGASGGTGAEIVRFNDGTCGLRSYEYGGWDDLEVLTVRYSGGQLTPTKAEAKECVCWVYAGEPVPGTFEYFAQPAVAALAYASTQTVLVDGVPVEFQAYALKDADGNDTNYIKLRDVASVLNGSAAQFNVGWDGAVNIERGKAYEPNGSEMHTPFSGDRAYEAATAPTNIDGAPAGLEAILLKDDAGGAYTYYKLRDLGTALGFVVDWAPDTGITVTTR